MRRPFLLTGQLPGNFLIKESTVKKSSNGTPTGTCRTRTKKLASGVEHDPDWVWILLGRTRKTKMAVEKKKIKNFM